MAPLIRWSVAEGAISAWYDTSLGEAPFATHQQFIPSWPHLTLVQLIEGNTRSFLERHRFPLRLLEDMSETMIGMSRDQPIWTLTSYGSFSCSSSWEHFRHRSPKRHWDELIWHRGIVPWDSFSLWKLMH